MDGIDIDYFVLDLEIQINNFIEDNDVEIEDLKEALYMMVDSLI